MTRIVCCGAICFFVLFSSETWGQENWPRFRGVDGNGVAADDSRLPETWSKTENVKWVADLPGWGWSCPVVWGDKVFVTTVVSDEANVAPKKGLYLGMGTREPGKGTHHWLVYCFDLNTGEELWIHEAHTGEPKIPRHPKSSYASETPTTDGERVYVLFGDLGLYAYDFEGNHVWTHEIEPRKTFFDYGAAASPVVHEGQVIYVYDNQEESYITSLDAKTGKERWRTPREGTSTWATPFVWKNEFGTEIVVCGKRKNRAYDLKGKELWSFSGRMSNLVIPSPLVADDMLYITSGYIGDSHRPVYAMHPGATGDVSLDRGQSSNDHIAWYLPTAGPYNPSPIVYDGLYYTLHDRGFLTCHDAKTGEEVYGRKRIADLASYTASPWAYNGKLFFLSEDGVTYVVKAGPEYELLASNSFDELCLSTPAIANGNLLIRTASKLYCISNSE